MTLVQAIGVILGANIGTTITGWILVLKIGKYGLPILGICAIVYLFSRKEKLRYIAMAIMGSMQVTELHRAVINEDVDALTVVPGIGKRSAQRLLLELKPKLVDADVTSVVGTTESGRVREALEGLGYGPSEIREVIAEIPAEAPLQEQLRVALKALGRQI